MKRYFVVAFTQKSHPWVAYLSKPPALDGGWFSTAYFSDAYKFKCREQAETVVILDGAANPERLGLYEVVAVTDKVEFLGRLSG